MLDRRGQIPDMARLSERPSEANDRVTPCLRDGDLMKDDANKSAVSALVERTSRLVMVAKMTDGRFYQCAQSCARLHEKDVNLRSGKRDESSLKN